MLKTVVYALSLVVLGVALSSNVVAQSDDSKSSEGTVANRRPSPTPAPPPCPTPSSNTNSWTGSGGLDTTFGSGGIVTTDVSGPAFQTDSANAVLVQADGSILTVGDAINPNGTTGADVIVSRYLATGSLDTTFGSVDPMNPLQRMGYLILQFTDQLDSGKRVAIDSTGRIVVGGWGAYYHKVLLAKLDADGQLDPTFGTQGMVINNVGVSMNDMILQSDDKIVISGDGPTFAAARFNSDGSLDGTFGTGGVVSVSMSTSKRGGGGANSIATQMIVGEERIVLAGQSSDGGTTPVVFTLMRFGPTGAVDTSFGTNGKVLTAFTGPTHIWDHKIDSLNRIVVAGDVNSGGCAGVETAFARYLENGALDLTFSGDGKLTRDVYGGGTAAARSVAIQTDGKIVGIGFAVSADKVYYDSLLIRLLDDGTPDTTFGPLGFWGGGVVTTDIGGRFDIGLGVALQPDGKIVTGGRTDAAGYASTVARYLP